MIRVSRSAGSIAASSLAPMVFPAPAPDDQKQRAIRRSTVILNGKLGIIGRIGAERRLGNFRTDRVLRSKMIQRIGGADLRAPGRWNAGCKDPLTLADLVQGNLAAHHLGLVCPR